MLTAATSSGYRSLGWHDGGRIVAGALADFTSVALTSPRLAGSGSRHAAAAVVFAATAGDVHHVVVGGRVVVADGVHQTIDVAAGARSVDRAGVVMSSPSTVIDNIGRLITNDAQFEVGATGELRDAWVVMVDGLIELVGTGQAPIADQRIDAAGRCVLPGFVDSHSHLVFAGDRSDEFAARMAGRPYEAGGIRTSVAATRAATDDELLARAMSLLAEAQRSGTTTIEIKSGYGLTAAHEARTLARRLPAHRGDHVPGRPCGSTGVRWPRRRLRRDGLRRDAGRVRAAFPVDRRILRARRVRCRPVRGPS